MKGTIFAALSLLISASFLIPVPASNLPGAINYQGKLTDTEGQLADDGLYKMVFKLYEDDTTLVWTETFDGANKIQVTDGLFAVPIGTGDNDGDLETVFNENDNLYLGLTIADGSEMTPRQRLASAGYVLKAGVSAADNPPGAVQMFGGDSAPSGWLLCDGTAVSRSAYADLFSVIGTTYGAGDGSTTFNLPDLQDRFPIGKSGTRALGTTGGSETIDLAHSHTVDGHTHSLSTASLNHRHSLGISLSGGSHAHSAHISLYSLIGDTYDMVHDGNSANVGSEGHGHDLWLNDDCMSNGEHSHSYSGNTGYSNPSHNHGGATGSASPGTNSQLSATQSVLPPYQVVNYIIKY